MVEVHLGHTAVLVRKLAHCLNAQQVVCQLHSICTYVVMLLWVRQDVQCSSADDGVDCLSNPLKHCDTGQGQLKLYRLQATCRSCFRSSMLHARTK
jgi:hypothetical protein